MGDVAQVLSEGVDREMSFFVGDAAAMTVRVDRSDRGDAIGIQDDVERVAAQLQAGLPAGVNVELIRTRAEAISGRLDLLISNGLMGLGLVVGLLFLFLNARTAFWVAAGIPVAMGAAIALMYLGGLTINMISLFGLIITLGIVVDDAIVVGEHADHRYRTGGMSGGRGCGRCGTAHGDAGLRRDTHDGHRLFRAGRGGRALRRSDPGYPLHGDRSADRVADRMLSDPAASHEPRARRDREAVALQYRQAGARRDRERRGLHRAGHGGMFGAVYGVLWATGADVAQTRALCRAVRRRWAV